MRVVMVMFDSLNRHMLPPYGCDWTHAPNFQRLAQRTVKFNRSYVCSMPCMPARRDFHTGRPNFLHRSWGPIEPFDDSVPQMLKQAGVHTHLVTDHYHYFEDGGATYHHRYSTWEAIRGQEGDAWIGQVRIPEPGNAHGRNTAPEPMHAQDRVNRQHITHEHQFPQSQTFRAGIDYIRRNLHDDNWFLQIETFDPHEPFFSHRQYKDHFAGHYEQWRCDGKPLWDWPPYNPVTEPRDMVEHMRYEYASLLAMCDAKLGDILDTFDELDLWKDTMLVVWTDHGFMLGEHDSWAKMWMGFYNEVAQTPFFIWDPRCGKRNESREALVQPSIDLGPTLLNYFGLQPTADMLGKDLAPAIDHDQHLRGAAIYGMHGCAVNVTDGRYTYFRGPVTPDNSPLYDYTLMPTHMRSPFSVKELEGDRITLAEPFPFTKNCRTMRIPAHGKRNDHWSRTLETRLFDIQTDPGQQTPLKDAQIEARMVQHLERLMRQAHAPAEQFERLGLAAVPVGA